MAQMKVVLSQAAETLVGRITKRDIVRPERTDYTDVGAVVITDWEQEVMKEPVISAFNIPLFIVQTEGLWQKEVLQIIKDSDLDVDLARVDRIAPTDLLHIAYGVLDIDPTERELYIKRIEMAVQVYEERILPPFFRMLDEYVNRGNTQFNCPGHQGGQFFRKHPTGRVFYDFYGETLFRSDLCNADVQLGDLLIHEGYALEAQEHAAEVFHADKTYFVLNGTSSSNKVVLNALLTPGDLVLYDRNNHKSISMGALVQAGAVPIYLETERNPYGAIGGIPEACFDEGYIRERIRERMPEKADAKRPIRLAVIELGTYDGTVYNAKEVVRKIGHLCDYILFDSAWVGYEQFIPMMKDCSPLLLDLGPDDPGIFVTQSVHKQMAGFSQTSQIHKKDKHIKGQDRYVNQKRFNNAFMMHASTSPFYPLFAALDVNARMHEGEAAITLWGNCLRLGIEARKRVLTECHYVRPFVPPMVHNQPWENADTETIAQDKAYFVFEPNAVWHSFAGYGQNQYFVDPCKFYLTTPGIDVMTGGYSEFGIPAVILATYLREYQIIPEKNDLNTILFLMTPAESETKMEMLLAQLVRFEKLIDANAPMREVLPSMYKNHMKRYRGYTIRQLCQEMHDFYRKRQVSLWQKRLFQEDYLPQYVMSPQEANIHFVRGHGELVPVSDCLGRVAMEGALPYPPGIICVQPGERWSEAALAYFEILEEYVDLWEGFELELQGVYWGYDAALQKRRLYAYVLKGEYGEA